MSSEMSKSSQAGGRAAQKARTRAAIVAAARQLSQPNVEQAADAAGVSRATAYRYFPTQEALEVELASSDVWRKAEVEVRTPGPSDVERTIERLIDSVVATVGTDERQVRTALRVYHDTWLRDDKAQTRRGRRMEWIDTVISPLPPEARAKLRLGLALAIGPDPVVMLKDVAGVEGAEARQVLKWAAGVMLRAALSETRAFSGRGSEEIPD